MATAAAVRLAPAEVRFTGGEAGSEAVGGDGGGGSEEGGDGGDGGGGKGGDGGGGKGGGLGRGVGTRPAMPTCKARGGALITLGGGED